MGNTRICSEYFKELFKDDESIDRYGIPFQTKKNKYYFDAGTGKVLKCSEETYALLMHLFENNGKINEHTLNLNQAELEKATNEIKEAIEKENIFKVRKLDTFNCVHVNNIEEMLSQGCTQLILEVTEACNLRCRYCIYGEETKNFRSFGTKAMSFETARKAIDYFIKNANGQEELTLSFYGGEPLLQYDLINKSSCYFMENFPGKAKFSMTSNLTLLNKEMAEFFAEHEFMITCSLDGDEEIHNTNRPFADGKGSFSKTVEGLLMLAEAYGKNAGELLAVNTVMDNPVDENKYQRLNDFFQKYDFLKENHIRTTYASRDSVSENTKISSNIEIIKNANLQNTSITEWEYTKMKNNENVKLKNMLDISLSDIHKRRISNIPFKDSGLNACCVPGTRRIYVTVDGNFSTCERIGKCPYIGNVEEGLDKDAVKKYYVEDYIEKSKNNCSNCWAFQMCDVCYADCYTEEGLDMGRKKRLCESSRNSVYRGLIRYHMILEENPDMLMKYNDEEYDWK